MRLRTVNLLPFAAGIAGALLLPALLLAQGAPASVRVKAVESRHTEQRHVVTGSLRALQRAELAGQEAGLVVFADIREGKVVKAGDVLLRLDDRRLKNSQRQAELDLQRAATMVTQKKAEMDTLNAELERRRQAGAETAGAVSQEDFERAQMNAAVAAAALQGAQQEHAIAQARLELLNVRLRDMILAVPFDGTIVEKHVEVGEWLNPGNPVATLVSSGSLEARFDIPEQFSAQALAAAKELTVELPQFNLRLAAHDIRVIPDIDPRSRQYSMTAIVDPQGAALAAGMSVTAAIPTAETADYLMVASDAILKDSGGQYAYKVIPGQDGVSLAMPVSLRTLFTLDGAFAVESADLKAGDLLVIEGNERLRPMTPVIPIPEGGK